MASEGLRGAVVGGGGQAASASPLACACTAEAPNPRQGRAVLAVQMLAGAKITRSAVDVLHPGHSIPGHQDVTARAHEASQQRAPPSPLCLGRQHHLLCSPCPTSLRHSAFPARWLCRWPFM